MPNGSVPRGGLAAPWLWIATAIASVRMVLRLAPAIRATITLEP
jgi:hypothetical protein